MILFKVSTLYKIVVIWFSLRMFDILQKLVIL